MAEKRHFPGGIVSVRANDDGKPQCVACGAVLQTTEMAMLLNWPETGEWDPWCGRCATGVLRIAVKGMADELGLTEALRFIV